MWSGEDVDTLVTHLCSVLYCRLFSSLSVASYCIVLICLLYLGAMNVINECFELRPHRTRRIVVFTLD